MIKRLLKLLDDHDFLCEEETINYLIKHHDALELTKKAYGDSRDVPTSFEFGKDYKELIQLTNSLGIKVPDYVWCC